MLNLILRFMPNYKNQYRQDRNMIAPNKVVHTSGNSPYSQAKLDITRAFFYNQISDLTKNLINALLSTDCHDQPFLAPLFQTMCSAYQSFQQSQSDIDVEQIMGQSPFGTAATDKLEAKTILVPCESNPNSKPNIFFKLLTFITQRTTKNLEMIVVADRYLMPSNQAHGKMTCCFGNERFYFSPSFLQNIYFKEVFRNAIKPSGIGSANQSTDSDIFIIVTEYMQATDYDNFQTNYLKKFTGAELPAENASELNNFSYKVLFLHELDRYISKTAPKDHPTGFRGIIGWHAQSQTVSHEHETAKKLRQLINLSPKQGVSFSVAEINAIKTNLELKTLFITSKIWVEDQMPNNFFNSHHAQSAIIMRNETGFNAFFYRA